MTPFEAFFDSNIWVINLARRPDRLEHFTEQMKKIGVKHWNRFEAIDAGPEMGNHGCTASHRALLDHIAKSGARRAFVFEDDAAIRPQFEAGFNQEAGVALGELPPDWDMVYLGGHYAEDPRGWFSKHLILMGQMKTTSSYGVTAKAAAEIRDRIPHDSCDGIDNIIGEYASRTRSFITEPRFFIQYENYSDLQKRSMNNGPCMEDNGHVSRLTRTLPT